ncbi:hypothetical protein D0868_10588 [Hortaea werneckii]|uniref:Uncharacterized protein n=1 Tax=Hortaea werneckii TaxID=91943 RepID=A0A3M6Y3V8_HORWE|nr:hypothetical protein D0868_10588 [Hortaea werneckii]
MKFLWWLGLASVAAAAPATAGTAESANNSAEAESQQQDAAALLASMPTCGVSLRDLNSDCEGGIGLTGDSQRTCLVQAITASPCELSDISCSCSNATLTEEVEACTKKSCSIKPQLSTKNATDLLCSRPIRNESKSVSYVGVAGGILAMIAYILRMVSRFPTFGGQLGWDDALMTFAIIEVIPLTVFSVICKEMSPVLEPSQLLTRSTVANLGLGKDIWKVSFENITGILKVYYFDEDLYLTALPIVKMSMLCFYLRIFPNRWFKISCWVTMACCFCYGVAFLLVSVFQCRPLNYAWHHWDGEHNGTCNNINAQGWTSAAFNVILDVVVIALPLPLLAKLQLNKRKKFLVMLMFSVGFVVTVISILRLQVLVQFGNTTNFTYHYKSVGYWSTAELDLAVICACMPGIRLLIKWARPRLVGDTTRGGTPAPFSSSGYATGQSGLSYDKKSRASRPSRDLMKTDRDDKDFIPLVNVNEANEFNQGSTAEHDADWPIKEPRHNSGAHQSSSSTLGRPVTIDT